ncbi:MAG: hypothetical protein ROZ36_07930 [Thermincola sp.]|nr:hypothetical protein [Thermincola sp.]
MVFYTGKIVLAMNNPTVVIITDRNDLDDQLLIPLPPPNNCLDKTLCRLKTANN